MPNQEVHKPHDLLATVTVNIYIIYYSSTPKGMPLGPLLWGKGEEEGLKKPKRENPEYFLGNINTVGLVVLS